jgi:hypothetical protein
VDVVDEKIGKHEEKGELGNVVPPSRALIYGIVYLGVAANLEQKERGGQNGHYGKGDVGLAHLKTDLVLEISRVVEGGFVENEDVGEGSKEVVDNETEEPGRVG